MSLKQIRRITIAARKVPGLVLVLELLRKHYIKVRKTQLITDFDSNLLMELDISEHMASQIFWYGSYSRDLLSVLDRLLFPGMVVADIGANIGEITLFSAKRVGQNGCVFAFEPMPSLFETLKQHVEMNNLAQVRAVPIGLADVQGSAMLYKQGGVFADGSHHAGLPTLYASASRSAPVGNVPLTTFDAFWTEYGCARLDLVKIDVEGAELPVLRGAEKTLRRFKPMIILELQEEMSRAAGYKQQDVVSFLDECGYVLHSIRRGGSLTPVSERSLSAFQNVVALAR